MTLTASRRATSAAVLILAATLAGCGIPDEPASPAPPTWAIPIEIAQAAIPTAIATQAIPTNATAAHPTPDTTHVLATDPTVPTGIPAATNEISNPTYDLTDIDRTDPAQVTWAYLTNRLSRSYTDPGAGLTAAAQYAGPQLADQLTDQAAAEAETWPGPENARASALATLTHLSVYVVGDRSTVIATWTLTITTGDWVSRTTMGLSATLSLIHDRNAWSIATDGIAQPN